MERCGWNAGTGQFVGGAASSYELYYQFGLGLGKTPTAADPHINALTCAVVPLPDAQFHHFGTSAQMIDSVATLQNLVLDETRTGMAGARRNADQVMQNSRIDASLQPGENHSLWIENSLVPDTWRLASEHVITGAPENRWPLRLEPGVCLDFAPIDQTAVCVRAYGFRDSFGGKLGEPATQWLGRPASDWFAVRGLKPANCGLDPQQEIQQCALFPVVNPADVDPAFLEWLWAAAPAKQPAFARRWRELTRLSAADIGARINLRRLYEQRSRLRTESLVPLMNNFRSSVFFRLDLESTAAAFAQTGRPVPELKFEPGDDPMHVVHNAMFRSAVLRHRSADAWPAIEAEAFAELRRLILREAQLSPALPRRNVIEDQIVWARSPVRLDLAGGWTDTPPYCIEHGGRVVNIAADINGQPPIQVFARLSPKPEIILRSIDLGIAEHVRTYTELETFGSPGHSFALAKAALALAGFLPRFHAGSPFQSLDQQLTEFGGGLEISLLSAVPKGSGLGASSILAATLLAALSDLCGLGWDRNVLFTRTLALEQMLTTGGGWQDQAGAVFGGIKLIETSPGLAQKPTLRWLPTPLFDKCRVNRSILLYYTGITRLAKNILAEIVRGIFLNAPSHLEILARIGANADHAAAAIQQCDYPLLLDAIRTSWHLNQQIDSGTNPPEVRRILDRIHRDLAACKLLGAGGGGYMLLFAADDSAATRIRDTLTANPPNPRARFVEFNVSDTGLQVTRS